MSVVSTNQLDYLTSMCFEGKRHVDHEWRTYFQGQTDVCLLCPVPHTRCALSWQQKRLRKELEIQEADVLKKAMDRKEQQQEAVVYWSGLLDRAWADQCATPHTYQARRIAVKSFLLELQQKRDSLSLSLMPITCDCVFFDPAPTPPPLPTGTRKYREQTAMTCPVRQVTKPPHAD